MRKIPEDLISAKDVAKQFRLSYQSVNYYTNIGLFKVRANRGNKRLYSSHQIARNLKKIREFKRKGYSLRVIRDELL
ncbi:MAG: MerR family transcriptional regulator [Candidatus Omnitrophica bacterium]|nr:MerR family transcriptional regulator [Candidatus Omnitrophota bacterium]